MDPVWMGDDVPLQHLHQRLSIIGSGGNLGPGASDLGRLWMRLGDGGDTTHFAQQVTGCFGDRQQLFRQADCEGSLDA